MPESSPLFPSTHWSAIVSVRDRDSRHGESLERLCEAYYYPVYAMVRSRGHSPENAQDLTQEFFQQLIGGAFFSNVTPSRGRFRYFLIASIKNFLANDWQRSQAQKRGGNLTFVSINADAEDRYKIEPSDSATPDQLFDQHCALATLDRAMQLVREQFRRDGNAVMFENLKEFAVGESLDSFADVAQRLNTSEGSLRVAVHRLRKRIAEAVRAVIRETVESDQQVDEEIRYLKIVLQRGS